MHRRIVLVVLGLFLLQLGTGCYRWRAHRMARLQRHEHLMAPAMFSGGCGTCSSCEASPLSAATLGTPIITPIPSSINPPTLDMPSSAEPPVRMPAISSRPLGAPVGLRR